MGLRTNLSILRFEFHSLGAAIIAALLMLMMFALFAGWQEHYAVLVSFAVLVFLISLVRIDLGLVILIVGMLFSPEVKVGEAFTRGITLRAEDFLILSLFMAWVVRSVLVGVRVRWTPLNTPIVLFVAAAVVSTAGGIALGWIHEPVSAGFYIAKLVEFFAVFMFTVNFVRDEEQILFFLGIFLAVGAVVSLYGLSQVGEVTRITAPFEGGAPEPNTFGGYLMTVIGMSVPFAVFSPYLRIRVAVLIVAGLAFTALLFTLSRASFVALVGMFVILGLLCRNRTVWFALALFLILHQVLLPQEVFERINYTFQSASGVVVQFPFHIPFAGDSLRVDKSTFERIGVWQKVLYTWTFNLYYFLFGWGITRLQILDSQFARFLVEIGLVGTGLFTWILWRIFRTAWWLKNHTKDWVVKSYAIGYLACFIGVLIHSLGTITFYIVRIMEPFWFLTGIMVWWYLRRRDAMEEGRTLDDYRRASFQPDLPWRQVDAY